MNYEKPSLSISGYLNRSKSKCCDADMRITIYSPAIVGCTHSYNCEKCGQSCRDDGLNIAQVIQRLCEMDKQGVSKEEQTRWLEETVR